LPPGPPPAAPRPIPRSELIVEVSPDGLGRIEQRRAGAAAPAESYTLVTADGRNLAVSRRRGAWLVADAVDYGMHLRRNMPRENPPAALVKSLFQPAGTERVGNWAGVRYRLPEKPWAYEAPSEMVVMKSGDYGPLGRVLGANYTYSLRLWPIEPPKHMRQMADLLATGLPLRIGDATLKTLTLRRADPSRFQPPSRPLTRDALFGLLDADAPKAGNPPQAIQR
jgi:hypothetical protein